MIGEKLGELHGKITGQRVLPTDGGRPRVETSVEISGTLTETEITLMGTDWSTVRADGSLYGEWQRVTMAANGEEASFVGQGVRRFTETGGVSFREALYSQSMGATMSRLQRHHHGVRARVGLR